MRKNIFISIIIPAYKEAQRIGNTLLSLSQYFKNKEYSYEVIVVNDGSPDNLVEVVKKYISHIKNLKIINNKINSGKGHAVKCGMIEAKGKYRLFMDADNSVSISNLDTFMKEMEGGTEIVIGSIEIGNEIKKEHNGLHRRLLSRLSKMPVRIFATPGIFDTQRGFKLFSEKAAEVIFPRQTINRFAFDIELLAIALVNKLKIKEVPVAFDNPEGSTVAPLAYIRSLVDLMKISIKKVIGVYSVSSSGSIINTNLARIVMGAVLGVFLSCMFFGVGFLIGVGINLQAKASYLATTELQIPFLPELQAETPTDTTYWIYSKNPMTKKETGQFLIVSLILILLGSDLVSGMVLPRAYIFVRKVLSAPRTIPNRLEGRHVKKRKRKIILHTLN